MRRNVPSAPVRPAFITGDSFQMMYRERQLLGFIDLEMGLIGDPMLELAGLTLRSLSEPTADFESLCRRYAELAGEPLDLEAIFFHVVGTAVMSAEYMVDGLTNPDSQADYHEYHIYYLGSLRVALEVVAEITGVALSVPDLPEAEPSPSAIYLSQLHQFAANSKADTQMANYERQKALIAASYAAARDKYVAAMDRDFVDDTACLLGIDIATKREAEEALEKGIADENAPDDKQMLEFFYRHVRRACRLAAVPEIADRNRRFLLEPVAPMLAMYRRAAS
jgi:hypothetical protein